MSYHEFPQFQGRPDASPEKQAEYLRAVVKCMKQKISDLQTELATIRLQGQLDYDRNQKRIAALADAQKGLATMKESLEKDVVDKKWWKLSRSKR